MRTYPPNSPQAVARILAMILVADGNVSNTELDVIEQADTDGRLNLERHTMQTVMQTFCEDLLQARHPHWADACQIDPGTLDELLAEIEEPALRAAVLRLCAAVAAADNHVADGELVVLASAATRWGLRHEMLTTSQDTRPH